MRIGTRGSALALAQARLVADLLQSRPSDPRSPQSHPHGVASVELVTVTTTGDRGAAVNDKSRWVVELERALAAGEIDLAVHSAKDVPGELADGLALLGAPPRAAPEDVLCLGAPLRAQLEEGDVPRSGLESLPHGTRVGTSSVRRAAQLRAAREDLEVVAVRGNVDTRLRKLHGGQSREPADRNAATSQTAARGAGGFDALVLAHAGLQRLGREPEIAAVLDPARFIPSPGQGTLALEGRADDECTRAASRAITDAKALACLRAERAVAHALGANCNTPLGALALDAGCGCLHLRAWVGLPDGSAWVADELLGGFYDPESLGRRVAERMLSAGAGELLRRAEELAAAHA